MDNIFFLSKDEAKKYGITKAIWIHPNDKIYAANEENANKIVDECRNIGIDAIAAQSCDMEEWCIVILKNSAIMALEGVKC